MKKKEPQITNTTKAMNENPMLGVLGMMSAKAKTGDPSAFIEDMERRGTQQLAGLTSHLPAKGSEHAAWAKMGVVFGEVDSSDPLWRAVTLPAGWNIRTTEHAMWNHLLDDKGRKRALIFYKAAFYDRRAHIIPERRYVSTTRYPDPKDYDSDMVAVIDNATGESVREWPLRTRPKDRAAREQIYAASVADGEEAEAFLRETYPECDDPAAYW